MNNNKHINEVSPEFMWKAAAAQRRKLKDNNYLKSITAFDYLKKLKRVQDFEDYADEIVAKINAGQINEEIPNEENEVLKKVEAQNPDVQIPSTSTDAVSDNEEETTAEAAPLIPLDIKSRKREMKKAPAEKKFIKFPNPIVNRTSDFDTFLEGDYVIVYISNIDDDVASVWMHADSKADAANETIRQFWDVKEIIDVFLKSKYNPNDFHRKDSGTSATSSSTATAPIIDPESFNSTEALANTCASIITGGEFNNMTELVADIKDDQTTENTTSEDEFYEGQDIDGRDWEGKKSSVRMVCESENFDWASKTKNNDEYEVEIITSINSTGQDTRIKAKLSAKMIRKALSKGIVHIVFVKLNGDERQAFATTNEDVLQTNNAVPVGSGYNYNDENHVRFYDMTIKKWRSFVMERLTMVYDETY